MAADKPFYGEIIARRRFELSKTSLADIEQKTNGVLYTKLLYRIENGIKHPKTLSTQQLSALLKVLDWSFDTFLEEACLNREDFIVTSKTETLTSQLSQQLNATPLETNYLNNIRLIPVAEASAGPGLEGTPIVDKIAIPIDWVGDFVAYKVNGASMEPDIPDGAIVIVKVQSAAELGQTVVAYCPDDGWVIKQLKIDSEAKRKAILASKNPDYGSILFNEDCLIRGVVVEVRWRIS